MSPVCIRDMEGRDCLAVAAVWRNVFTPLTDEAVIEACKKMDGDSRYRIFVADIAVDVVGFVTTVEALALNMPNGYIKINGLAVLPEYRRRGIGKMLMERVEELARERDISRICLASGFSRTEAHKFYERLGYEKLSFWFHKRI